MSSLSSTVDNVDPVVDCSGLDVVMSVPFGTVGTTVSFGSCSASDNSGSVFSVSQTPSSGSFFVVGATFVNHTFRDGSGNLGSDTFEVTIVEG